MNKILKAGLFTGALAFLISGASAINEQVYADEAATIYAYDEYGSGNSLYIPWDQSVYQIQCSDSWSVDFDIISGNSATVNYYGQVTPSTVTYYRYGDYLTTVKSDSRDYDEIVYRHVYGDTVIRVTTDSSVFDVVVTVKDYGEKYADDILNEYISQNISGKLSEKKIIEAAAAFVADYSYSEERSTAVGMIVSGEGDCRAAAESVVRLLDKKNVKAWMRNDGAGHYYVMAQTTKGAYYLIDTGHNKFTARNYSVKAVDAPYTYTIVENGTISLNSYGGEVVPEDLYIPDEIDGYEVAYIGDSFLKGCGTVKTVNIPDTVAGIGNSAFNSCSSLKTINLPASVQTIGDYAFTGCLSLESFNCDSDSKYYSASKNVLFNADKTILIAAPSSSVLTVINGVKKVADYAAYCNTKLTTLIVMGSVEEIGKGAFGSCDKLTTVTVNGVGLKKIGEYAFAMDPSLQNFYIPASVKSLGNNLFYKYSGLTELRFGGSDAQWNKISGSSNISGKTVIKNTVPYVDVNLSKYYGEGVKALFDAGIMTGLTATTFGPDGEMSRAMVVTVLYRYEGQPEVTTSGKPFPDISGDKTKWYYNSISWAKATGVVNGYDDGTFGKDNPVLRQDFIKMLYSYAASKGYDVSVKSKTSYKEVADHETVSKYARDYVNWGYENQLIGKGSLLDPKGKLTRAQAATILYRFIKLYSL